MGRKKILFSTFCMHRQDITKNFADKATGSAKLANTNLVPTLNGYAY